MPSIIVNGPDGQRARVNLPEGYDPTKLDITGLFQPAKDVVAGLSERGVALIKGFERFSPTPYEDHGELSIGYGTRGVAEKDDVVTEAEADGLLRSHLKNTVLPWVKDHVKVKLQPHQMDAVVSLAYNVGTSALSDSRALAALNDKDFDTFKREAFSKDRGFTKVTTNGVKRVSPGLVGRRAKEEALFDGEASDESKS
jgi:lysozyme